jgi:hypothetical protein
MGQRFALRRGRKGIAWGTLGCRKDDTTPRRCTARLVATASLVAIVATGCAGRLAGSSAQVPCPAAIEAPTLYPGDTWILRYEDGQRAQRRYLAVQDGLLRTPPGKDGVEYHYDHTHTLRKVFSKGQWLTAPTPTFWNIGKPTLEFPLTPGHGWVYTVPARDDYSLPFVRRHTVVGCEQVSVPAETFVAVRIDVSQIQSNRPANAAMEWSQWYAPAVKFFVKQASGPATFWTPVIGFELESFTIDQGKPAMQ